VARVKLYVSPQCPRCEILKRALSEMGVKYDVLDISESDVMADLVMRDIFLVETPALEVEDRFFYAEDLFNGDRLLVDKLREVLKSKEEK